MSAIKSLRRFGLTGFVLVGVAAGALLLTACGDDDGEDRPGVEVIGTSPSGSASASGSGSGSGTGIGPDVQSETDNPLVQQAVDEYKVYLTEQIDELIAATTVFTDAIRDGDLEAAKAAYPESRVPWERIEPIAGLIEAIDGAVDARVDDFAGVDDPEFTGWHRLEYILFELNTTDGAAEFADKLDADLQTLQDGIADLELPAGAIAIGAAELIEEVSEGKITGEEDRYSKTDLWDFNANVEGAEKLIELLTPALEEADPDLLEAINAGFDELNDTLSGLRDGDGWVLFCQENDDYGSPLCTETTVSQDTIDLLKAQLAGLSENISLVAGVLDLE